MGHGLVSEDAYNLYDKPMFADRGTGQHRAKAAADDEDGGGGDTQRNWMSTGSAKLESSVCGDRAQGPALRQRCRADMKAGCGRSSWCLGHMHLFRAYEDSGSRSWPHLCEGSAPGSVSVWMRKDHRNRTKWRQTTRVRFLRRQRRGRVALPPQQGLPGRVLLVDGTETIPAGRHRCDHCVAAGDDENARRFRPDKGFEGVDYSSAAQAAGDGQPVQFERDAPEADPFGLDQFLTDVRPLCLISFLLPVQFPDCMRPRSRSPWLRPGPHRRAAVTSFHPRWHDR